MHSVYLGGHQLPSEDQDGHPVLAVVAVWPLLQLLREERSVLGVPEHEADFQSAWRWTGKNYKKAAGPVVTENGDPASQ